MTPFDTDISNIKARIKATRALGGDVYFTDKGRKLRNRSLENEQDEQALSAVDATLRRQDRWFLTLLAIPVIAALARDLGWL